MASLCSTPPPRTHPRREGLTPSIPPPDPTIPSLLQELGAGGQQKTRSSAALCQLQALCLWQEQNQRHAVELGAVPLLLELLKTHAPAAWYASARTQASPEPTPGEEATVMPCLNLLCSLCNNDDVAAQVAGVPACTATLVALLAGAHAPHSVTVCTARCLTNLTQGLQGQAEALEVRSH